MQALRDESGGIVVGWLTKLVVVAAVVGIIGFDFIAVAVSKVAIEDDAGVAAREARQTYLETTDVEAALVSAQTIAEARGETIDPASFVIDPDRTVRFTITKTVDTLLFHRVGVTEDWTEVSFDLVQAPPVP